MENIYNDYVIHSNGEIFRKAIIIKAKRKHGLVNYKLKGKQIKITKNKSGYMVFGVGGRKGKSVYLHRLLAKTFIPNPENKPYVNHIDNDPSNNRLDNLEWCTQRENIHHAMKQGRMPTGDKTGTAKLNWEKIKTIRSLYKTQTQTQIALKFGIGQDNVSRIINNKTWKNK